MSGYMGTRTETVLDHFDDIDEFEELLTLAKEDTRSPFEDEFVCDMRERFEDYGGEMFLSVKQLALLERIANK